MPKNTKFEVNSPISNLLIETWESGRIVSVTGEAASGKTMIAKQVLHLFFSKKYGEGYDPKKGLSKNAKKLAQLLNDYNQTMILTHDSYCYRTIDLPCYVIDQPQSLDFIKNEIETKQIKNIIVDNYLFDSLDYGVASRAREVQNFLRWLMDKNVSTLFVSAGYRDMNKPTIQMPSSLQMISSVIISTCNLRDEGLIEVKVVKNRGSNNHFNTEFLNIEECFGN